MKLAGFNAAVRSEWMQSCIGMVLSKVNSQFVHSHEDVQRLTTGCTVVQLHFHSLPPLGSAFDEQKAAGTDELAVVALKRDVQGVS